MIEPTRQRPQTESQGNPLALIILGVLILLGGGAGLYAGLDRMMRGGASQGWESVEGEVISSRVDRQWGRSQTNSRTDWRYYAEISYRYESGGERYTSSRIRIDDPPGGSGASGKEESQKYVDRFPVGAKPEVFVDPDDPTEAVLIRGTSSSGLWIPLLFGVLAIGAGVWMIWFGVKLRRKLKAKIGSSAD